MSPPPYGGGDALATIGAASEAAERVTTCLPAQLFGVPDQLC